MPYSFKITRETWSDLKTGRYGWVIYNDQGSQVSRCLPCWDRKRDAIEAAKFHVAQLERNA